MNEMNNKSGGFFCGRTRDTGVEINAKKSVA